MKRSTFSGRPSFATPSCSPGWSQRTGPTSTTTRMRTSKRSRWRQNVQGGVSGGPWFNSKGEIVGLQSGTMSTNGVPAGLAFVIPLDALKNLAETKKTAATPALGMGLEEVWQQDEKTRSRFPPKTEALMVKVLPEDRPGRPGRPQGIRRDHRRRRQTSRPLRRLPPLRPHEETGRQDHALRPRPRRGGQAGGVLTLGCLEVAWP